MSAIEYVALGNNQNPNAFKGDLAVTVREVQGPATSSHNMVAGDQDFFLDVTWDQSGDQAKNFKMLNATWTIEVLYDRIGGPSTEEGPLPGVATYTEQAWAGNHPYQHTFTVPAKTLKPGVYTLAVLATCDANGSLFTGYEEIRPFRVY